MPVEKAGGATDLKSQTGGRWNSQELARAHNNEINYLETLAAGLGLKAYCSNMRNTHVLIRLDNMTATAYLNNLGGIRSHSCNEMASEIWEWCKDRNIWLTAAHLPGTLNVEADRMSRKFNDNIEWMLDRAMFKSIVGRYGLPEVDLFATRLNAQLPKYISWMPDPNAWAVDAFTVDWGTLNFYAFPPFNIIPRCLQKIKVDNAQGLLVVPNWPTQAWFPILEEMLLEEPMLLPWNISLLTQPVSGSPHPLTNLDLLCLQAWRAHCDLHGLTERTTDIIGASWRESTKKQYNIYISKWKIFCEQHKLPWMQAKAKDILEFFSDLFYRHNASYSAINTARSCPGISHEFG